VSFKAPDTISTPRPAYDRAMKLIEALELDAGGRAVVHGALKAAIIADANDDDARAERHRGGRDV
jgi:hypothetical protein